MKGVFFCADKKSVNRVYSESMKQSLATDYNVPDKIFTKSDLEKDADALKDAECIFTTWGMEHLTENEIEKYFPNLKHVFYAAGSVQTFAKEFLNKGISVHSAWKANAVPVAEYTYAQILLATKGYFTSQRMRRFNHFGASKFSNNCGGNYHAKIGIIGVGVIGTLVAEKLAANDVDVFYYDPFLDKQKAEKLGIKEMSLEEMFSQCDVITNHLADKDELKGVLNYSLFSKMKKYATFINTGRGRQINEKDLAKALKKVKTRTALLDVTFPEPISPFNPLARMKNVFITPHIAGSNGREVERMAEYMYGESKLIEKGEAPIYSVSLDMLKTMA